MRYEFLKLFIVELCVPRRGQEAYPSCFLFIYCSSRCAPIRQQGRRAGGICLCSYLYLTRN